MWAGRRGHWVAAGAIFCVQPWPSWGDGWALEGVTQDVALMTHLETSHFGLVTGGERKRRAAPLLAPSPPASHLDGLHPVLPLIQPCSLSRKFMKTKMHSIPLKTKQINN